MRVLFVVVASVMLVTAAAFALPKDAETFKELYKPKDGSALASAGCLVCHDKMPPTKTGLNPYGADLVKQKTRDAGGFKAIENLDSDKDGFSNIAEIQAGTLPGDPASKPAK